MRLLLSHRFFWPDSSPYGLILRDIASRLVGDGHEVHVQTAVPSYAGRSQASSNRVLDGVVVYRSRSLAGRSAPSALRALDAAYFVGALVARILYVRPNVVMTSTFPPVLPAWAASLAARAVGARFVYHVQDIHPEASQVIGGRLGRGLASELLRRMDTATLRRADIVVTLTEDMARTLRARGAQIRHLRLIENPPLDEPGSPAEPDPALRKRPGTVRAIYAGNLGRFQNLPLLAEGVARLFPARLDLELVFLGEGQALPALRARWADHPQVRFLPAVSVAVARTLLAEADIGLVSLQPGMLGVASPSKVQTYAAVGLPMVALIDSESELAVRIEGEGLGFVARSATAEGVAEALTRALATPRRRPTPTGDPLAEWVALMEGLAR